MAEIILKDHRDEVIKLIEFIPWFEKKVGKKATKTFKGDKEEPLSMQFPVYEATLMKFINMAKETGLMNENYLYVYSHCGIKSIDEERMAIENATLTDGTILSGILSKYVLGGFTKSTVWTTAVKEGIFLDVLKKMKVLLEIWDQPLA